MQLCHGRRRCTISADTQTFGNPCRPDSRMYLKTVYTCGEFVFMFSNEKLHKKIIIDKFWRLTLTAIVADFFLGEIRTTICNWQILPFLLQCREKCCSKVLMCPWNRTNKINRNPIMKMNLTKTMDIIKKPYHQHQNYKEPFHAPIQIQHKQSPAKETVTTIVRIQFKINDHSQKVCFLINKKKEESLNLRY